MSPTREAAPTVALKGLQMVRTNKVSRNPDNPRIHFTEEEKDRLMESISQQGILVPVLLYPDNGSFVLVDGERRWLCATDLGLERIPAIVTSRKTKLENLVQMFNIHQVREQWQDMPTAWALEKYMKLTGVDNNRELADRTGLDETRIRRLRHALELPKDYQKYIDTGKIPLNWFWELKTNVIDLMARERPTLWSEFKTNEVLDSFVRKRIDGKMTDTVAFRNVRQIITLAAKEADHPEEETVLDETLRHLVRDANATIEDAYTDAIQMMVDMERLGRTTNSLVKGFERLFSRAKSEADRKHIRRIARELIDNLRKALSL